MEMETKLRETMGNLGIDIGAINSIFRAMEIAEEEIDKAQERHPEAAEAIDDAFKMLTISRVFRGRPYELYRAHCAELLDRVATGEDLELATRAEVLVSLADASLEVPLSHTAGALYLDLFTEVFGEEKVAELGMTESARYTVAPERAKTELMATLRRKGRVPGRSPDDPGF